MKMYSNSNLKLTNYGLISQKVIYMTNIKLLEMTCVPVVDGGVSLFTAMFDSNPSDEKKGSKTKTQKVKTKINYTFDYTKS